MVEGHGRFILRLTARATDLNNAGDGESLVTQDRLGWHAQSSDTLRSKEGRPRCILPGDGGEFVRETIDLNRKSDGRAVKVEDVATCRMLASEFEAAWACAQLAPQNRLWQAHFAAQLAGELERGAWASDHRRGFRAIIRVSGITRLCPSTILRMVPLPVPGRFHIFG